MRRLNRRSGNRGGPPLWRGMRRGPDLWRRPLDARSNRRPRRCRRRTRPGCNRGCIRSRCSAMRWCGRRRPCSRWTRQMLTGRGRGRSRPDCGPVPGRRRRRRHTLGAGHRQGIRSWRLLGTRSSARHRTARLNSRGRLLCPGRYLSSRKRSGPSRSTGRRRRGTTRPRRSGTRTRADCGPRKRMDRCAWRQRRLALLDQVCTLSHSGGQCRTGTTCGAIANGRAGTTPRIDAGPWTARRTGPHARSRRTVDRIIDHRGVVDVVEDDVVARRTHKARCADIGRERHKERRRQEEQAVRRQRRLQLDEVRRRRRQENTGGGGGGAKSNSGSLNISTGRST